MSTPSQESSWQAPRRLGKRSRQLSARGKQAHQVVGAIARALRAWMWAMAQAVPLTPESATVDRSHLWSRGFACASDETQPRCGVPRDGVQRLQHTRVPRARPAPDGGTEGGSQPTESSRLTRRLCLAPPLPMDVVHEDEGNAKKSVAHS